MKGRYSKRWWRGLNKNERRELVMLMTAPRGGPTPYLPDDCSECGVCSQPVLGWGGMCRECSGRFDALHSKADERLVRV